MQPSPVSGPKLSPIKTVFLPENTSRVPKKLHDQYRDAVHSLCAAFILQGAKDPIPPCYTNGIPLCKTYQELGELHLSICERVNNCLLSLPQKVKAKIQKNINQTTSLAFFHKTARPFTEKEKITYVAHLLKTNQLTLAQQVVAAGKELSTKEFHDFCLSNEVLNPLLIQCYDNELLTHVEKGKHFEAILLTSSHPNPAGALELLGGIFLSTANITALRETVRRLENKETSILKIFANSKEKVFDLLKKSTDKNYAHILIWLSRAYNVKDPECLQQFTEEKERMFAALSCFLTIKGKKAAAQEILPLITTSSIKEDLKEILGLPISSTNSVSIE